MMSPFSVSAILAGFITGGIKPTSGTMTADTPPSSYPDGLSLFSVVEDITWPTPNGHGGTFQYGTDRIAQFYIDANLGIIYYRIKKPGLDSWGVFTMLFPAALYGSDNREFLMSLTYDGDGNPVPNLIFTGAVAGNPPQSTVQKGSLNPADATAGIVAKPIPGSTDVEVNGTIYHPLFG